MRYAAECAYNGSKYQGWQSQPHHLTIQQVIEKSLSTLLRTPVTVVGCGRTDTGVHAKKYVFHFDSDNDLPDEFIYHLNAILPADISIAKVARVEDDFHARFDAVWRSYEYEVHGYKSPFIDQLSYRHKFFEKLNVDQLQEAADILDQFDSFFPFCLRDSNTDNYRVDIRTAVWTIPRPNHLIFSISANRFLRGMVRLVTGMCINVSLGQITLEDVRSCLANQTMLNKSLSLPAHGLYLTEVVYPHPIFE